MGGQAWPGSRALGAASHGSVKVAAGATRQLAGGDLRLPQEPIERGHRLDANRSTRAEMARR